VDVSRRVGNQIEGTVAINPLNPSQIFIASMNQQAGRGLSVAVSTDAGATCAE